MTDWQIIKRALRQYIDNPWLFVQDAICLASIVVVAIVWLIFFNV